MAESRRKNMIVAAVLATAAVALAGCAGHGGGSNAPASSSPAAAPSTSVTLMSPDQRALAILDDILQGDFTAATANFDVQMKHLTPKDLANAWRTYQEAFGKYQSHGAPADVQRGELTVVNIPLQMERMPGEFRVTFHPDGTVAGLFLLKVGVPIP